LLQRYAPRLANEHATASASYLGRAFILHRSTPTRRLKPARSPQGRRAARVIIPLSRDARWATIALRTSSPAGARMPSTRLRSGLCRSRCQGWTWVSKSGQEVKGPHQTTVALREVSTHPGPPHGAGGRASTGVTTSSSAGRPRASARANAGAASLAQARRDHDVASTKAITFLAASQVGLREYAACCHSLVDNL
jgi:hypothetical protein